jgi:hypothetical protein
VNTKQNNEAKLANFLKWIATQKGTIEHPVQAWFRAMFARRRVSSVTDSPTEIRVGFRYAYSERYKPDSGLAEMIVKLKAKRFWTVEEILALNKFERAA